MIPDDCPHCQVDLRAGPIPDYPGEFYSRGIGVEIQGVYDGTLYFMCPDCGGRWHRFDEDHFLRQRAAPYVDGGK